MTGRAENSGPRTNYTGNKIGENYDEAASVDRAYTRGMHPRSADFLEKEGCVIEYPRRALRIGNTEIPTDSSAHDEELKGLRVILEESVNIPGYTEMIIPAKVVG